MKETDEFSVCNKKHHFLQHWHLVTLCLLLFDFSSVCAAYFIALWVRFDCRFSAIPADYLSWYLYTIFSYAFIVVVVFNFLRLYRSIWRFASFNELLRVIIATLITGIGYPLIMKLFICRMPVSYYLFGMIYQFCATLGVRFFYRFVLLLRGRNAAKSAGEKRVMIIGAGRAGQFILRDIKGAAEINERVCCFIDDDSNKQGRFIDGIPVYGGRDYILPACEKFGIEKIYLTIPSASVKEKRDILNICKETNCRLMNLPGIYQLANGEVRVSWMREVAIEDLLGRDPIKADMEAVGSHLKDKVILVTGGGGSIGSELCRQIAANRPKQLIIFDVYENNAYDIQMELKSNYPELDLVTLIGSVRDSRRIFQVFEEYRPEIVYHAAAHKHVPLMEDSPCEAIKNNVIGTYKTAFAAMVHGCKRFVLISTDKAVNPTNIMGASKRACEMVIQAFDAKIKAGTADEIPQLFTHWMDEELLNPLITEELKDAKTEFVAVRFGNVLGSNGSVIPLFKKQIAQGGPVTVTHPDIIRYFMTIPEAVGLVLTAGTFAHGGEIFVLDMGEPVKIDALARNLIRLSGYKPDVDIKIEYSGLRPGEKLYEEKLMAEEGLKKTDNDLIHIGKPIPFDIDSFLVQLKSLMDDAYKNRSDIRDRVREIVTTYRIIDNGNTSPKTR